MITESKFITAKQIDDWAKLLFDALSRIALLSALAVLATRYDQVWLKLVVGVSALCLGYWIIGTLVARFVEVTKLTGPHMKDLSLSRRIMILAKLAPVIVVTVLVSWCAIQAVITLSNVQFDKTLSSPVDNQQASPVNNRPTKSN